jgi:hypothetical protein
MNSTSTPAMPANQVEALIERHVLGRIRSSRFRVLVQEHSIILQGCAPIYYA